LVSEFLDFEEVCYLSEVCSDFYLELKKKLSDLSFYISQNLGKIKKILAQKHANKIGFVLQGQYSFDGKDELTHFHVLRGKDKQIYDIMKNIGIIHIRPCELRTEIEHEDEDDDNYVDDYNDDYEYFLGLRICVPSPREFFDFETCFGNPFLWGYNEPKCCT
jgi:hypothetical protein